MSRQVQGCSVCEKVLTVLGVLCFSASDTPLRWSSSHPVSGQPVMHRNPLCCPFFMTLLTLVRVLVCRSSSEAMNPLQRTLMVTHSCYPWQQHMSSFLAILSLASSIQSCGEESAPAQPSVLVFKKAAQWQAKSAVVSIMSGNSGWFPPLTLSCYCPGSLSHFD